VGDHGVVFLCGAAGSAQKKRRKARDLAERASALARHRFGLSVHFGVSVWTESIPLSRSYEAALAAAESALVTGSPWELAELDARRRPHSLRHLRDELTKTIEEQPHLLQVRFDRYLEAVAGEYGYRLDPGRAQLELAFERLSQTLLRLGALDDASYRSLYEELDRVGQAARTISELFGAYRRVVTDVAETMQRPSAARQDRHLRGAMEYIHRHYAERLKRAKVARVAGFAPGYFSLLFKQREKKTFEEYVQQLRIERAKQLLESTRLDAARVAELSGFATPQYFSRSFRRSVGVTPLEHRRRTIGRGHPRPADQKISKKVS
jgi:AraC-like DNA-binding protein